MASGGDTFRRRRRDPRPGFCALRLRFHAAGFQRGSPQSAPRILAIFAHAIGPLAAQECGGPRFRLDSLTRDFEPRNTDYPMAHAVAEEEPQAHMGLPLPHGKLAMWLFLVTEIMFFTGMIGTYI